MEILWLSVISNHYSLSAQYFIKNAQIAAGGNLLKNLSFVGVRGDSIYIATPEGIAELPSR